MSQAQASLACAPLSTTSSPAVAPSGTRAITKESEPMMTGAPTSPMVHSRPFRFGEALAADLQFTAGDGRGGSDLRDLRLWSLLDLRRAIDLIKIEPSCRE